MDEQKNKDILFDACALVFGTMMVFYQLLPSLVIAGCSFLFFTFFYYKLSKKYGSVEGLAISSIIAIPTSTISVIGGSYSVLPLTWYNLLILIAVCIIAVNSKLNKRYFISVALFAAYGLISCSFVPSFYNGFKQYLIIILFFFTFFIGEYLKNYCEYDIQPVLVKYYLISCFSLAFQVFLQRAYIQSTGMKIGHYATMGQGRVAYGGIMGDWSFATLFLASGCLLLLLNYVNHKSRNLVKFVVGEIILLFAMLFVSSRTGIVALGITILLYFIFNTNKLSRRLLFVIAICTGVIPIFVAKLMSSRGGQALFETSGRAENYIKALGYWTNKPMFGYGLGLENLHAVTNLGVPHNYFIQYLIQIGIIGLILITIPFVQFVNRDVRYAGYIKWVFILIAIGSMFIPDIVSSRYLYGVVLICMTGQFVNRERCYINGQT